MRPFLLVDHDGFRYHGVIQNGFQIGALAETPDGRYVQVNGAIIQPLSRQKVQRAIKLADIHRARLAVQEQPTAPRASTPVVIVRRRRYIPNKVVLS